MITFVAYFEAVVLIFMMFFMKKLMVAISKKNNTIDALKEKVDLLTERAENGQGNNGA